ncbi:MAG: hypothetical protein CVU56_27990 [Deltaproteobacteria bacterium HGW-Deltaproteobacteria-14]|nr:MAG: hypothetical protein CVU56_27990 [Deltaproteobacteria bacterium HGW-Deltaproteobacteria-14]
MLALVGASCGEAAPGNGRAGGSREASAKQLAVHSRDGVLTSTFPIDVVVHEFEHSVGGTSADGAFRLYLEHRPAEKLIRVAGATKDALVARGWEISAERHYEAAIEVRSGKGKGNAQVTRVTWFVARAGRVLICEGIARDAQLERLDEPLKQRCERVELAPLEEPKPQ